MGHSERPRWSGGLPWEGLPTSPLGAWWCHCKGLGQVIVIHVGWLVQILGCGWAGFQLARDIDKSKYNGNRRGVRIDRKFANDLLSDYDYGTIP